MEKLNEWLKITALDLKLANSFQKNSI